MKQSSFAIIILIAVLAQPVAAKDRTVALWGHVLDSFTRHGLPAKMTLMLQDSTVVDTTTAGTESDAPYRFDVPVKNERYIIRAVYEGYDTCYVNYHVHHIVRNDYFDAPWHYMKRRGRTSLSGEHSLDEVVVTGTKIRMVQRGDTIVYDASAFNLPEGSMLDALVRQLPGAELKSNGDIYVNGRKIDYLTLNGTDFFKGKNKVMLDNLPYYTVKDIKVYNKSSERSRFIGEEVERKDFVMDVNLKREYSQGTMGNAEGGAGTSDRYLARLFGLVYTDKSRLGVYGFMNNLNEERSPGGDGDWTPAWSYKGLTTKKEAGFDYSYNNGQKLSEHLTGSAGWTKTDNETVAHSESYADGSSIIGDSHAGNVNKSFNASVENTIQYRELVNWPFSLRVETKLNAGSSKASTSQNDSTLQGIPSTGSSPLTRSPSMSLANRSTSDGYSHSHEISVSNEAYFDKKLPWGDHLDLRAIVFYSRTKPSDSRTRQHIDYPLNDSTERRAYNADTRQRSYYWQGYAGYMMTFRSHWTLEGSLFYTQNWESTHNDNWLDDAPDPYNSFSHSNIGRDFNYRLRLARTKSGGGGFSAFSVTAEVRHAHERMHYTGCGLDTMARRSYYTFSPVIQYYVNKPRLNLNFMYNMDTDVPDFATLMPHEDTRNAVARTVNNPHLKRSYVHQPYVNLRLNDSIGNSWHFGLVAAYRVNGWGQRAIYDRSTGAYTSMQGNVDPQWGGMFRIIRTRFLDKARRLTLESGVSQSYNHVRGFAISYDTFSDTMTKTDHLGLGGNMKLAWSYGKLSASASGDVKWTHATSDQTDFTTINAWDFNYGATLNYTLPWDISLATDLRMYSRRGYSVDAMNSNDLVWNALLSRSFLKGRLTAKLTAFDLLRQLSNTEYRITPQGHTETWHNSIPRYVMFSLAWKFHKSPKKQR